MEDLIINETQQTPLVVFKLSGELLIQGISLPSNVHDFYDVIYDWIDQFEKQLPPAINLTLHFEYFNTSSSLTIHGILKKLIAFKEKGVDVTVTWVYEEEDYDMYDEGVLFQNRVDYQFRFETIN
jgi:hypothetical protein